MRMKLTMVALAFFASVPGARAEVMKHPPAGLQFELPTGWKTRVNAGQLVAEPPDGKSYLSFAVIEEASIKGYVEKWAEGMKGRLTDLQVDVDDEVNEVNGLQQIYSVGSATLEGKPIQWDLTIVKGGRKVLAVMALGENLDGAAVQKMYASIRRLAPDGRSVMKGVGGGTNGDPDSAVDYPSDDEVFEGPPAEEPTDAEPADEEPHNESRR
jgi:predicted Zn-dependent protease